MSTQFADYYCNSPPVEYQGYCGYTPQPPYCPEKQPLDNNNSCHAPCDKKKQCWFKWLVWALVLFALFYFVFHSGFNLPCVCPAGYNTNYVYFLGDDVLYNKTSMVICSDAQADVACRSTCLGHPNYVDGFTTSAKTLYCLPDLSATSFAQDITSATDAQLFMRFDENGLGRVTGGDYFYFNSNSDCLCVESTSFQLGPYQAGPNKSCLPH